MDNKELGLLIATKREALGVSQGALAKTIGCSRPYVSQIEQGRKKAGSELLLKIMAALGLDYKDFLLDDAERNMTAEEEAILENTMPVVMKLGEYLTSEQFNEIMLLLNQTQEAEAVVQAHLKKEPMPSGPDGWLALSKEDRRLVQRIVNRLLNRKE